MNYSIVKGIENIDRKKWEDFVLTNPNGTIFQSPDMYDLYLSVDSYDPLVLAIEDKHGDLKILIVAVVMHDFKGLMGKHSARTLIYGGPLIDPKEKHPEVLTELLLDTLIKAVEKKSLYIQIRNLYDQSVFEPIFRKKSFVREDHLNRIVSTGDPVKTLSGISRTKLRQARQSFLNGADVVTASTEEEIHEMYLLLDNLYKSKVKKPLPPESFFLSFFRASQQGKLGLILIAKYEGKVIGGMVCPITPGKSLNEWYICGQDKALKKVHPSVMLTYGAIDYALNYNIPNFDFMGIGSPDVPYGVRDFKTQFGGKTVNYGRYLRINNHLLYSVGKAVFLLLSAFRRRFRKQSFQESRYRYYQ